MSVKLCLWTKNFLKIPDQSERDIQIPLEITPDPKNASASGKVNAPIDVPSSGAGATQGPGQNTRKEKEPGVSLRETEREIQIPLQITSDPTNASASGKVNAPIGVPSSAVGTTQGPGQNTRKEEEPGVSSREASPPERDEGRICNDDFFYRHLNQYHMSNCGCRYTNKIGCMFVDHFHFLYN